MESTGVSHDQLTKNLLKAAHNVHVALARAKIQQVALKAKAGTIRNQIQDDVSYHLELLRNREVWLMEQADVLLHLKEESMENDQEELCASLAKLNLLLELVKTTEIGQNPEITEEVNKLLSSMQNCSLNAEESALDIRFFVDNFALADAIKEFGGVTEELEPGTCTVHFVRHDQKRTMCAQDVRFLVKEYFNTVWNSPSSEWLAASSATSAVNEKESRRGQRTNDGVGNFFDAIQQSDTKDWLHKEEEPFHLETITHGFTQHFQEVKRAPLTDWIVRTNLQVSPTSGDDERVRFLPYDASEKLDSWLLTPKTLSQTTCGVSTIDDDMSFSDCADQSDHFQSFAATMETESSLHGDSMTSSFLAAKNIDGKLNANEKTTTENWLLPRLGTQTTTTTTTTTKQEKSGENWLRKFRESMGKSVNDWLSTPSIDPKYCEWLTRESQERCEGCPGECAKDTFKVFRDVYKSPTNQWLVTATDW